MKRLSKFCALYLKAMSFLRLFGLMKGMVLSLIDWF